jgi:general secretion pathway protein E
LLGAILEQKFGLSEAKLLEALNIQQTKGGRLGEALIKIRAIEEDLLLQALAMQFEMTWLSHLDVKQVDQELIKKVPIHFARRYRVLPLRVDDGAIVVATIDPLETAALDDLRLLLGMPVKPVLTGAMSLMACLNRAYDEAASPTGAEQVMEDIAASENLDKIAHELDEPQDLLDATDEAPIIRLVNSVLFQAVRQRASDIHFESFERGLVVRYRIDGVLYPILTPPKHLQSSIIARLKIMAGILRKSGCLRTAALPSGPPEKMWTSGCPCCRHRTASVSCCACLKRKIDCSTYQKWASRQTGFARFNNSFASHMGSSSLQDRRAAAKPRPCMRP